MNAPTCRDSLEEAIPVSAHIQPDTNPGSRDTARPVVIVGGGPAGIRMAQELSRRAIDCVIFNAERWQPYNRVNLTPLLCGDVQIGQVVQPLRFPGPGRVALYSGQSVVDIDRQARTITTSVGRVWPYNKLVLCTGSRAHVPPIPGADLPGVYTFRNFDDAEKLVARSFRSRRTAVVGGGLLGLEAARGMASRGVETVVIEHEAHLMARQLDQRAGQLLAREIENMGLAVQTGASVARIAGVERVERLELSRGEPIACDTVILCTGIRANMELARDVGVAVGRGIKVSDAMVTSDPHIYAVGECAEFEGHIYGLVGPGFEQASVAAAHMASEQRRYAGSVPVTKLKIVGCDVFSMGDVEQLDQRHDVATFIFENAPAGVYRRLVCRRGRIVGALAIGDWPEVNRLQEAIRTHARILPWQRFRFERTGRIWADKQPKSVRDWPRAATVCNCTGATRGQIGDAIELGAVNLEDVKRDTGASSVCGSCRVHIEALLGGEPQRSKLWAWKAVAGASLLAALTALLTLAVPVWSTAASISARGLADHLWLDGFWKQVSGYTLLGLSAAAAVLSLRKRIGWLRLGDFAVWRLAHTTIAVAALLALFAHTGFRLGENLNFWLMASFLSLSLAGAGAGLAAALEHRMFKSADPAARARTLTFWLHLIAFWPLPLLLGVHVLTVYFY